MQESNRYLIAWLIGGVGGIIVLTIVFYIGWALLSYDLAIRKNNCKGSFYEYEYTAIILELIKKDNQEYEIHLEFTLDSKFTGSFSTSICSNLYPTFLDVAEIGDTITKFDNGYKVVVHKTNGDIIHSVIPHCEMDYVLSCKPSERIQ